MALRFLGLILLILLLVACDGDNPSPTATLAPTAVPATPLAALETAVAAGQTPNAQPTAPAPTNASATSGPATDAPAAATLPPEPAQTRTPRPVPANVVIELPGASLPPGFSITRFADLYRPTSLAFDRQGHLFATGWEGDIFAYTDSDGDGHADLTSQFSFGFITPLGIAFHPTSGDAYVSSMGKISLLRDVNGDLVADSAINLVRDLPSGLHQNNTLKFGPDGMLYMGVGSTCDVCDEFDPRSATLMRFDPLTGVGEVIATGLRNNYDIAFEPTTGAIFGTDNGRDDLGLDRPFEELNHLRLGHDYGWPGCWDDQEGEDCAGITSPIAFFEPHSSVNSLDFYSGHNAFPTEYDGRLFIANVGSWLTNLETGIYVVSVIPDGDTFQTTSERFAVLPGSRPLGLVIGPDGALYFGDYELGAIWRISYGP